MTVLPATMFMWGALAMASLAIALFFLRFWRLSKDRLFAGFALAFSFLAINWIGLGFFRGDSETRHWVFMFRLAAFAVIIAAVVDKNRRKD